MSTPTEAQCDKCGIGFVLPSGVCDHCNQRPAATVKHEHKELWARIAVLAFESASSPLTDLSHDKAAIQAIADSEARAVEAATSKAEADLLNVITERDAAEDIADRLTSGILGEEIDWPFHDAKWQEAIEALPDLVRQRDTALAALGDIAVAFADYERLADFVNADRLKKAILSGHAAPVDTPQKTAAFLRGILDGLEQLERDWTNKAHWWRERAQSASKKGHHELNAVCNQAGDVQSQCAAQIGRLLAEAAFKSETKESK